MKTWLLMQDVWFPDPPKLPPTLWDRFVDCNYGGMTTPVVILTLACWLYVLSRRSFGNLLWPIGILSLSPLLIGYLKLWRVLERTADNIEGWHSIMDYESPEANLRYIERAMDGAWLGGMASLILCGFFLLVLVICRRRAARPSRHSMLLR
ncbi:MAG: hypothetical protein IPK32_26595 [Verrucomicrobiaceae bacterium]|nr:hypothetical protein [Verrucomicrobiaceae bacterium]